MKLNWPRAKRDRKHDDIRMDEDAGIDAGANTARVLLLLTENPLGPPAS
jgi:hypothetical protein